MRILIGTDGSWHSRYALEFFCSLPLPPDLEIRVVTVLEDFGLPSLASRRPGALAMLQKTIQEQTHLRLRDELSLLKHQRWRIGSEVREGHPADELLEAIQEFEPDLTVVGSRGLSGFTGYLLGRVSYRVATHCPSSVLIARPRKDPESGSDHPAEVPEELKILLALDGSETAWRALESLVALPLKPETEVTILRIMTLVTHYRMDILQKLSDFWQEEKDSALKTLDRAAELLAGKARVKSELREGEDASSEILSTARDLESDLLVLGHKGMSSIEKFLLGSVSSKVVHHAPCSVLIVKGRGLTGA